MSRTGAGQLAAVDLGATSGRVMLADVREDALDIRQIARFRNDPVYLWDGTRTAMHWDVAGLFGDICAGLAQARRHATDLVGVAVDSWAVDYGLLRAGSLLGQPFHYRDSRCDDGVEAVHATVSRAEMHARNGLQFLPFNTVYQLAADRLLDVADTALLIPDLIGYWLTGTTATERTNASTTGLLRTDGRWDHELTAALGFPEHLFPAVVDPGTDLGPVLPEIGHRLGWDRGGPHVSTVASHDTASAVVAVPMAPECAVYISCGTWALVGVELAAPVLTEAARAANFTNEVGADGRIRFLRNTMGLWLLTESIKQWQLDGIDIGLERLLAEAADCPPPPAVFDTDDATFAAAGDMPARIARWYTERGLPAPTTPAQTARAVIESLAATFADRVGAASHLSGTPADTVHIVGGGALNTLLCQRVADLVGVPVIAGPVEATATGNLLIQARSHGMLSGDLDALRATVAAADLTTSYQPQRSPAGKA
ncbi:rhamnulokinase [Mycolicibacterium sp. 018/SC-01/001]|uniref:rhamnulokinase n=1 Tax=Mycolicibacterium sp. 018/SC-01/001 TaxID=2592069 RepID=UPI00117D4667|nr:rhamnulokinase family protein [Mycolicibacterium sp. 018/SC-01/001]TRW78282.1 rhamnulokinase [Mycolicibacterium sp. 018/SC-01/001]